MRCSCGYRIRGKKHEEGEHHKKTKPSKSKAGHGVKTNVGDPEPTASSTSLRRWR